MTHVTIVIPFVEVDHYLFECLESLTQIDDPDLDLILVHDKQVADLEMRRLMALLEKMHINHQILFSNIVGLPSCLNLAIKKAKGDYICRLDSDDLYVTKRIGIQREYLDTNPTVAVVGGQLLYIDHLGNLISGRTSNYPVGIKNTREAFEEGCYIAHPATMLRKAAIEYVGGYREQFKFAEDYDLWLRILDNFQIDNLPDVVLVYREHSGQSSRKADLVNLYSLAAVFARTRRRAGQIPDIPNVDFEPWIRSQLSVDNSSTRADKSHAKREFKSNYISVEISGIKKLIRDRNFALGSLKLFRILVKSPGITTRQLFLYAARKFKGLWG
jgi:glycosyltransferase involved in cell wall biosynthesis